MKNNFTQGRKSLFLLLFLLLVGTSVPANVSEGDKISLEQAIQEISMRYDVYFTYNKALVQEITVDFDFSSHQTLEEVMEEVLAGTKLRYRIHDDKYVIIYKSDREGISSLKKMAEQLDVLIDQEESRFLSRAHPVQILKSKGVFQPLQLIRSRLELNVSGTVMDQSGEPLIGVNVIVKGTTKGTATDFDGRFEIEDVNENAILVFSYVGYQTQEVSLSGRNDVEVIMEEDLQTLDEVVVVGYGTVRKRDLTGSVSSIKASEVSLEAAPSIEHALRGKVAGLSLRQNSAQPGGGLDVLIRGAGSVNASNQPLFIVDGFPIAQLDQPGSGNERLDAGTQGILNFVNPNDIESIEVLKDASATAIYGSRAANGVVIVTTKRGEEGKTKVNYSQTYGVQKHADIYDVFELREWMQEKNKSTWDYWLWENEVSPYGGRSLNDAVQSPKNGVPYKLPYTDTEIENAPEKGTDWIDLVTRDGNIQQHNVSVQGGSTQTKFMASLNYFKHDGIIKNSSMNRYSGKVNVDQKISDIFSTGINLIASRLDNSNVPLGAEEFEKSGIIRSAVQMGPHIEGKNEAGQYPINPLLPTQPNPFSLLTVSDNGMMDRILSNAYLTISPAESLFFKFNVGLDRAYQSRKTYMPRSTLHGGLANGLATINENNNEQYLAEITGNYSKTLREDHRIGILGGYSYELFKGNGISTGNNGFLSDVFIWNNLNAGEGTKMVGSWGFENERVSFFSRVNYTFKDRYLLTGTFRADGASVFAKNNKWGYFPSVAVGWNISEENFMDFVKPALSYLKLRFSYGQTGNSDIGSNAFASYYASPAWNTFDNGIEVGVFPGRLENPDLKWETTTELNLGIDYELFHGRLSGAIEVYDMVVSDLLNMKELNAYHSISSVMANIGKTRSRGFELTLSTRNVNKTDFRWNTDLNFFLYRDTWLERTADWKPSVYESTNDPIRALYSRVALGILQEGDPTPESQPELKPGQLIIADIDGYVRDEDGNPVVEDGKFLRTGKPDGIIDDADTRLVGTVDPGYTVGFSNTFMYKNFDLNVHFYGMFDRYMSDPTRLAYGLSADGIAQYSYNALRSIQNRWMPGNPSTVQPSSFYGWSRYGAGDWFLEPAWFVRLQNVTLGYTIPNTILKNNIFESIRLKLDVNNIYTFTKYGGLDPETDSYTAAYPNARTYTIGIDIKF